MRVYACSLAPCEFAKGADVSGAKLHNGRSPGREVPASPVSESRSEDRAKPERTPGFCTKQFQDTACTSRYRIKKGDEAESLKPVSATTPLSGFAQADRVQRGNAAVARVFERQFCDLTLKADLRRAKRSGVPKGAGT